MATSATASELTQVVKEMLAETNPSLATQKKGLKFSFVVQGLFVSGTLQNVMDELEISSESVLRVEYFFALDKPKPEKAIPQEEWISHIATHGDRFAAAFFNGDVKLFEGATEKLCIKRLHCAQITSQLLYTSPLVNAEVLVTCSEFPEPAITVSSI